MPVPAGIDRDPALRHAGGRTAVRIGYVASAEAKNLEAISQAIDQHNSSCPFPAAEVRMNPFEAERLGWDSIRGIPITPDSALSTGRFRIVCSNDLDEEGLEEVEAVGSEVETAVPAREVDPARNAAARNAAESLAQNLSR